MDYIPQQMDDLKTEELPDNEAMILNADMETVYILNSIASILWNLFDGQHTVEKIISLLHETMPDTEIETISDDVSKLITELEEKGLIVDMKPLP